MKLKKAVVILSLLFLCNVSSMTAFAQEAVRTEAVESSGTARANTGYIYKTENGKLYRRLYDFVNQKWLSDWELCP